MSINANKWHAARLASETEYASGAGDSAYDQTKLASVVGMPHPKSYGDNMFPMQKIVKEEIISNDDGVYGGVVLDTGYESVESSREEFIQDSFYLDKVIAMLALQGSLPPSYAMHWQDHIRAGSAVDNLRYDVFGVYVKGLALKIPVNSGKLDSYPFWTVKESCHSIVYDTGAGTDCDSLVKVPWLTNAVAPLAKKGSITIGGVSIFDLESELNIDFRFDEDKECNQDFLRYPNVLGLEDLSVSVTMKDYSDWKGFVTNVLKDVSSETLYDIKFTSGLASCFPQVTNMRLSEGDLNRIPEKDTAKFVLKFVKDSTSVFTKESS